MALGSRVSLAMCLSAFCSTVKAATFIPFSSSWKTTSRPERPARNLWISISSISRSTPCAFSWKFFIPLGLILFGEESLVLHRWPTAAVWQCSDLLRIKYCCIFWPRLLISCGQWPFSVAGTDKEVWKKQGKVTEIVFNNCDRLWLVYMLRGTKTATRWKMFLKKRGPCI